MAVITFILVILLLAPLVIGMFYYKKREGQVLYIDQDKTRDPRYFSLSFSSLFEKKWKDYQRDGNIVFSRSEKIIEADQEKEYPVECDCVVVAEKEELHLIHHGIFSKEIYAMQNAWIQNVEEVRAVCCRKNMMLGDGLTIVRWVDAFGTLVIYDDCNLGVSATSGTKLMVGCNCKFKRLYAPAICLGQYPDQEYHPPLARYEAYNGLTPLEEIARDVHYIDDSMADENLIVHCSIVTRYDVVVVEGMVVQGNIRSHHGIRLCDNAVVCGNLFAEEDILLGENSWVFGTVFTQENIIMDEGGKVVIGRPDQICSVIARGNITFQRNCIVYGYVSCENTGAVCPEYLSEEEREEKKQLPNRYQYLALPGVLKKRILSSVREYENIGPQGFRNNLDLEEVVIPEGVYTIKRSMFYNCKSLARVVLPSSLLSIEDFAFYNCGQLKSVNLNACENLQKIGKSAFENCKSLIEVRLPAYLLSIGAAAFCGCRSLKQVIFEEPVVLTCLEKMVFKDCCNLEKIHFPASVNELGVSVFNGCLSLKSIRLGEGVKTISAYAFMDCNQLEQVILAEEEQNNQPGFQVGFPQQAKTRMEEANHDKAKVEGSEPRDTLSFGD